MKYILIILTFCVFTFPAHASNHDHQHESTSKYAGQEERDIKSLSQDDISELQRGGGWGLAKAAELNGVPGPVHLLELKDQIPITASQVSELTKVYEAMKTQAIDFGLKLISLEQKLEQHFLERTITDSILRSLLDEISIVRGHLRYTHLAAHLKTPAILSEAQIRSYNSLRGYSSSDACSNVPAGHNAEMWKQHNGCI